ncbi:hypothetical protein [Clostridium sulfidigenes]|nr:hypothetical protein [Clostridium sulfidigenes]
MKLVNIKAVEFKDSAVFYVIILCPKEIFVENGMSLLSSGQ